VKSKKNGSWASDHKVAIICASIPAVAAIIVSVITIYFSSNNSSPNPSLDSDYYVNYSSHNVLLEGFSPVALKDVELDDNSIVYVERIDSIVKNRETNENYFLPFYTTGKYMQLDTLKSSVTVTFREVNNPDEKYKHSYELELPIGMKPVGHNEIMHNRFKFVNGFRDDNEEWWIASIKYPTKAISVHILCPSHKPCKSVKVYRRNGFSAKKEITDNPPFISEDGSHIFWMGNSEKPDTRIMFSWQW